MEKKLSLLIKYQKHQPSNQQEWAAFPGARSRQDEQIVLLPFLSNQRHGEKQGILTIELLKIVRHALILWRVFTGII